MADSCGDGGDPTVGGGSDKATDATAARRGGHRDGRDQAGGRNGDGETTREAAREDGRTAGT